METNYTLMLEKSFSQLGKLQDEMQLQYAMSVQPNGVEFCVRKIQNHNQQWENSMVDGLSSEQGELIINFMHQNAVPFEKWRDILEDLLCIV